MILDEFHSVVQDIASDGQVGNIVQTCMTHTGDGKLLDSIKIGNDGATMRSQFNFSDQIDSKFKSLESKGDMTKIAEDANFKLMISQMKSFGGSYLIPKARADKLKTMDDYKVTAADAAIDSKVEGLYTAAFSSHAMCDRKLTIKTSSQAEKDLLTSAGVTVSPDGDAILNSTDYFIQSVNGQGVDLKLSESNNGGTASVKKCNWIKADKANVPTGTRLRPWGNLLKLHQEVIIKTDYKCDTATVEQNASGKWVPKSVAKTCTHAEFDKYIRDMATTLETQAAALDTASVAAFPNITGSIKKSIYDFLINPTEKILDGMNCKFIYTSWSNIMDVMCWTHTPSVIMLSQLWFVLALMFVGLMGSQFYVWRWITDNLSLYKVMNRH